jgi:hypothetical protein
MQLSNSKSNPEEERRKYVSAFNTTMIKIWREQIALLGVIDTGALYRSTIAVGMNADGKFTSVTLSQSFNTYGVFQDYGTGRNTPRGNPGDIGHENRRIRRRWFSRKYYASVMNIREFFADNIGREFCNIISLALDQTAFRQSLTK